jgi:hypothetical protein
VREEGLTGRQPSILAALIEPRHARKKAPLLNRYYDPSTEQFLSVDSDVAQTGQPYAFTADDPLNATDPLGLSGASDAKADEAYDVEHHDLCGRQGERMCEAFFTRIERAQLEHLFVDLAWQDEDYLAYWGTYVTIEKAKQVGSHVPGGTVAAEIVTSPLASMEAAGLGGDVLGDIAKGQPIWQEDQTDQPLFGHQIGGMALSNAADNLFGTERFTQMEFPGLNRFNHQINLDW